MNPPPGHGWGGAGNPLPEGVRLHLEQGLNHDLGAVRIHEDAEADRLAKGVNATAFTTGTDIYFQAGRFNPNTQTGLELLAHEVTHTVQQSQGRVGTGIDLDAGLEGEARATGRRLAAIPLRAVRASSRAALAHSSPHQAVQRAGGGVVAEVRDVATLKKRLQALNGEMALTMAQAAADVAGIADPTPISDGISAAISLYRGDFLGAGLSVLSMIPGLGDAIAKPIKGSKLAVKLATLEKEIRLVTQQLAKATSRSLEAVEAAARASRRIVATEVLTRLPKNWTKIRGLIGKKYSKALLPSDYYEKVVAGQRVIVRKKADDSLIAPLAIDAKGNLVLKKLGDRLSNPATMRSNFRRTFGREVRPGYQIHHLVPDNLIRAHPMGQAAEHLGISLDRGHNLLDLPGKTAAQGGNVVGHWSSHPKYDQIVTPLLDTAQRNLEKIYGSLDLVPKGVMEKTMDGIAGRLRKLIEQKQVPLTPDGRLAALPASPDGELA